MKAIDYKNIYYPPGGILLWLIIFLELITFGIALVVLAVYSNEDPILYHESSSKLNATYGAINTIFLLTSGFFMATSLQQFRKGNSQKSSLFILLTVKFHKVVPFFRTTCFVGSCSNLVFYF